MQRLYLQFYLTILVVLAVFVGAAALLWRLADDDARTPQYFEVAAELTGALLPYSDSPTVDQQRAIEVLHRKLRFDIAFGKAWGTLGMGFGGRELARRATRAPAFMTALQTMSDGRMVPAAGGVLIRNAAGTIVGAVGISGDSSDNDELCAVAGFEKAGLAADTGDPR